MKRMPPPSGSRTPQSSGNRTGAASRIAGFKRHTGKTRLSDEAKARIAARRQRADLLDIAKEFYKP